MWLGVPSSGGQLGFLIEHALNQLIPSAEPKVREVLTELGCIEQSLKTVKMRAQASRTGETYLRATDEISDLEDLFIFWVNTLSDIFGVPPNPFSLRHQKLSGQWTVSEPT